MAEFLRESEQIDNIWPTQPSYPRAPYRDPNQSREWATLGEKPKFDADCAAGRPNQYGPHDINYAWNGWGFRCIDFDMIPDGSYRVLSVGCSNTEGIGLPLGHTWPALLCSRIQETLERPVVNLNLGIGGTSNRGIAIRTLQAVRTLRPDVIFIGWTYLHRHYHVFENGRMTDWWSPNDDDRKSGREEDRLKLLWFERFQNQKNDLNSIMVDYELANMAASLRETRICHSFCTLQQDEQAWLRPRAQGIFEYRAWDNSARDLLHPGLGYNRWLVQHMMDWFDS